MPDLRSCLLVAGFPLVVYLFVLILLTLGQRHLLYRPPSPRPIPGLTPVWLDLGDAVVPMVQMGPQDGQPVLFMHGNGGQLVDNLWIGEALASRQLSVSLVEYPGFGLATGVGPSEEGLIAAARAALATLPPAVCVGHSLGSGVATAVAAEGRCVVLVLVAPFSSIPDMAALRFPIFPARWLVRDRFDSAARAPGVAVPVLITHGRHDRVVPFEMGEALAARFADAEFVPRERGHVDIFDDETFDRIAELAREASR